MSDLMEPIKARLKSDKPVKWLFAGDSITHGALHTWGHRDYTEHFSERVRYELDRRRDIVIKTGVSGWTAAVILDDLEWSVLQFKPDVVALMIGTNDCHVSRGGAAGLPGFRENVLAIIDRIAAADRNTAILLQVPNPIWPEAMNERGALPLYAEALRQIARERHLPLVDHCRYWQDAIKENSIRATAWMNDPLHPGPYGHLALARLFLQQLDWWDASSPLGRLFLP